MMKEEDIRARVKRWHETATPEEKEEMFRAQRESWRRAFKPCEHNVYDFEQCGDCRA